MAYEYHLKHWGEVMNAKWLEKELGVTEQNNWFSTALARAEFRKKLQACADRHRCSIAFAENDGCDVRLRTVASMTMRMPNGFTFDYKHDFGYAFDPEAAHFMWHDGNYSCDCNKSLFLIDAGHDIDVMDCGHTIILENFCVKKEP